MDKFEAERRFAESRVARLATLGLGERPHLVPITFAVAGGAIAWVVDEKPKRTKALRRLANIRANPNVSVLADRYDEDWQRLWWVRADGTAAILEGGPDRGRAVAALTAKYPQYTEQPPTGPAVLISVDRWSWWSAAPGALR